ncbi:TRAFAC clade GTPase domain-containing protein [Rhodococcoides fascians]|uniref:TRAFAC clade GTPase domain-containing protein n=1 Tax=Rhodococcoides fascians TaxID=1828 RepID=UPI001D331B27|nr:hypothetical protein [Rhodococcus fascians]CAH0231448.1 hypothetical protein SRABI91_02648 [Rhodococcus fascians]
MEDIVGPLIAFVIGLTAIFFVLWTVLALIMRLLAILVIYWIVTFLVGLTVGLLAGLAIPLRVLRGRAMAHPVIVTPEAVAEGKVITMKARGAAKNFGWDRAWPVYNPYQARNDARAVIAETKEVMKNKVWPNVSPSRWNRSAPASAGGTSTSSGRATKLWKLATSLPGIAWTVLAGVPLVGFFLGVWVSILFWLVAMAVLGGVVYLIQQAWILAYRWFDKIGRKKERASLKCAKCYRETDTPSYKCSNPSCTIIHRDVSPGPLGMMHRRCECGTRIPTTVRAAAKVLTAICPFCSEEVAQGSGTRRTIQIPTIGAVAAGKTRLLAAGVTTIETQVTSQSGKFAPLSPPAVLFLQTARSVMATSQSTAKTPLSKNPEGWPYMVELGARKLELHFVDAAGESFVNMDTTQSLGYIDTADVILLVIDPLGLPGVFEEAKRAGLERRLEIATADQEDAYASVIDRLRAENVNLKSRKLGVVLTKLDALQNLPSGLDINPGSSDGIRQWLIDHGQDGFVRRLEDDFADIAFFGTDLMQPHPLADQRHPVHVFQWLLDKSKTKITIAPVEATASVEVAS